jgi:hypothetical protein
MDSFGEVRRIRQQMSEAAGHDIRVLLAEINKRRPLVAGRLIDPGTKAEQAEARTAAGCTLAAGTRSPASVTE